MKTVTRKERAEAAAIDLMTPSDLDAVAALDAAVSNPAWSRAMFASELANVRFATFLVARAKPAEPATPVIAGYLGFWVIFEEAHILNVVIHPAWRRLGLATRLVREAFDRAATRGATRALLEVRASNAAARGFYARFGFDLLASRAGYYNHPKEDALIMACELAAHAAVDGATRHP